MSRWGTGSRSHGAEKASGALIRRLALLSSSFVGLGGCPPNPPAQRAESADPPATLSPTGGPAATPPTPTASSDDTTIPPVAVDTDAQLVPVVSGPGRTPPPNGPQYYVDALSPSSSDANPGTAERPFRTLRRATEAVRAGDTVWVRPGVYREVLRIEANGTPTAPIVFRATGDGPAIIDAENTRSWCVVIGRNRPEHDAGHYVVVDGLVCRNPRGKGFPGADGSGAGIFILGTQGVVVRGCRVYRDDYPGYPRAFPPKEFATTGIWISGHNVDTLVENCTVHHMPSGGIGSRLSEGDVGGFPLRPVLRWNHVSWNNIDDEDLQNFAGGMGFSNGTRQGLAEYNLVHHCGDFGIGTDDSAGHVIRYNVAYRANHAGSRGGGGDGIKTKPGKNYEEGDLVHHNVAFLNRSPGFNVNVLTEGVGARVFHNLAYGNGTRGITCTGNLSGKAVALIQNNICFGNTGQDLRYKVLVGGIQDYNYVADGGYESQYSAHNLSGGQPGLADVGLLSIDANGDGTPDLFDRLNDPEGFADAEQAILYALAQVRRVFSPVAGSRVIDVGGSTPHSSQDLFGQSPRGAPDLGPIEYPASR
jgi:hypothetical protein